MASMTDPTGATGPAREAPGARYGSCGPMPDGLDPDSFIVRHLSAWDRSRAEAAASAELYAAEDRLIKWIDSGSVRLDGVTWAPEADPLFENLAQVKRFCHDACDRLGVPRVTVAERRGADRAEYEIGSMTIRLPPIGLGGVWAMRGLVVAHELAHHLTAVGGRLVGGPHGQTYRLRLGHVLNVLGYPVQAQLLELALTAGGGDRAQDTWRERIAAILRQAESTPHPEEAATFQARAQELATRHAIDLAVAAARDRSEGRAAEQPEEARIAIGTHGQRWLRVHCLLFFAVAGANDLECLVARDLTTVYAHGMPSDLDLAVALYESLRAQMRLAADRWIRSGGWKQEGVHPTTERGSFYDGFVVAVQDRLDESRRRVLAQANATADGNGGDGSAGTASGEGPGKEVSSVALALMDKRRRVKAFHEEMIAKYKPGKGRAGRHDRFFSETGFAAGTAAGRRAAMGWRQGAIGR